MKEKIRLSKLMSEKGICSRREADTYIEKGLVEVDGEVVDTLGTKVSPDAEIALRTEAQNKQSSKITIILNKPLGYVSCQPEKGYKCALSLIKPQNRDPLDKSRKKLPKDLSKLGVVGRLDINSKGLLILTQDGTLAKKIIGPTSNIEKEYLVRVHGDITKSKINKLHYGLKLDNKPLKRAQIEILEDGLLKMILKEGKKRQIRRMCEQVDLEVISLKRVRVGDIMLGKLPLGKWKMI